MKRQFKVINRVSRKEQIFNSDELQTFFKYLGDGKYNNKWSDYAISVVTSAEDIIVTLVISLIGISLVILITKLIMQWI
jgi:hypothetical protein|tara:strand:+ start:307 stop:543 length:237 start_codon:yes stop_codon:yes gene_type:complete